MVHFCLWLSSQEEKKNKRDVPFVFADRQSINKQDCNDFSFKVNRHAHFCHPPYNKKCTSRAIQAQIVHPIIIFCQGFSGNFLKIVLFWWNPVKFGWIRLISAYLYKIAWNMAEQARIRLAITETAKINAFSCPACPRRTAKRENAPRLPEIYPSLFS